MVHTKSAKAQPASDRTASLQAAQFHPVPKSSLEDDVAPLDPDRHEAAPRVSWDIGKIRLWGAGRGIQTKLVVNEPGDRYEQEADRVAEQVMRSPDQASEVSTIAPRISRVCSECEEEDKKLHTKAESGSRAGMQAPPIVRDVLRSPGEPLDGETRAYMEPRFRQDFSRVRVHCDQKATESARAVGAYAYAAGRDVVFGRGQYAPSTPAGRKLLAHELAHVVQQDFRDASSDDSGRTGPGSPAAIQRQALNCPTKKAVEDECAAATANCLHAAGDCKSEFPDPGDLDRYIANIKATFQASDFGPNAKRNFAHWLDGSGSDLEMPSALFEGHEATKDALAVHRDKMVDGVKNRLADGRMKPNVVSDVIPYSGHANAFGSIPPHSDDLAYSVGGFQLCSNVRAKAVPAGDTTYNVDFVEWKCQAHDCYNWDPGKGIGSDLINDTKLCCVENAGKAKHFLDHSTVWDNKDPDSTKGFSVPGAGSGSSAPSTTPSKKNDKDDSRR